MDGPAQTDTPPLRLVLDTNVWLDLLVFDSPRCAWLRRRLQDGSALALSDAPCRDEWRRVLGYPALRLDDARIDALRQAYDATVRHLDAPCRPQPWPALPRCRDRDDQKFLELALAGQATLLLSRDDALLALDRRTTRLGLFRIRHPQDVPADPVAGG